MSTKSTENWNWEGEVTLQDKEVYVHADAKWDLDDYDKKIVIVQNFAVFDDQGNPVEAPNGFADELGEIIQEAWENEDSN